jgi:hypothetical protein
MISQKKNSVSVDVDAMTMKALRRASKSLSELASAYITAVDSEPTRAVRAASR